jgi:nucleoside-diphosphate-sugar epimerase
MAEDVIKYTGSKSEIVFVDPKAIHGDKFAEANDKYPDDTKATKEIMWNPLYDKRKVIEDTYEFMSGITSPEIMSYLI